MLHRDSCSIYNSKGIEVLMRIGVDGPAELCGASALIQLDRVRRALTQEEYSNTPVV